TADDFDWSAVKATPGTYAVTLNATGIKKITDANANTTLAVGDVQAGQATITSKTPTTQAIKATIGDVTKTEDGNAKFTEVPTVTVSDQAGHTLTTPDLAITDFDWSAVQAVPGTYDITLNATGINKILAANVNTTLATTDIAAGHAIITAKTPTTQAIKATIGNLTKDYDGTITFKDVPIVTVSDQAGHTLTTPTTLTKDDFDWSNVKADASTYDVTLTAAGIKKITDANANTTLATSDITAGQAIINKAAITITATNASKTQGQADPALTATVIGKPTAGSDVKYTVSRDKGETPATYDINVTANATDNPNYTITTKKGVFTIVPADSITATVGNVDKTYDGKAFDTTVVPTVTLSGFATVVTPNFTHDDFDWSKVGTDAGSYSVTLTAAGLKKIVDANKGVTAVASAGNAVIKQADVTITANNATKVAGQADPTLTAKVSVQPAAGAKLVYTVSRAAGETVGTYPITVTATAAANPNYHITVVGGQFTITKSTATFDWTADYVDSVGNKLADPESGTDLHAGDHYTTTAKYIDGYYLTAEPADAAGTIKDGNVTVKYVYNKVGGFTITTPNGQVTTIAYAVDHTDPTKVSVPLNQTVPYVSGYDAVSPAGKLTLVDPADPTKGYKLPAMTTPDANTAITYVAVNNGGGGTNGNGTITPSNNAGTTTNSTNQTTGNETTPSLAGGNDHGGSQATKKQPSKPAKKAGKRTAQKTSTTKQAANTGNRRATTGQAVASNHGKQPSGQSGATSQATSTKSVAKTNQAHKQLANEPIEKAATLPQTGDSQSSAVVTWLGAVLVGFLGLFGLKRKRRF
ncbi:MBG domain-containing protein, partial [Lentilactobacillus kisonensis]|uniref:MBG domain-containing protein n=1 Tax=Lentilactobacillus kisonensis TaxID=481722 RepID=UPI000AC1038A